jgi:hypothetical protein
LVGLHVALADAEDTKQLAFLFSSSEE